MKAKYRYFITKKWLFAINFVITFKSGSEEILGRLWYSHFKPKYKMSFFNFLSKDLLLVYLYYLARYTFWEFEFAQLVQGSWSSFTIVCIRVSTLPLKNTTHSFLPSPPPSPPSPLNLYTV